MNDSRFDFSFGFIAVREKFIPYTIFEVARALEFAKDL